MRELPWLVGCSLILAAAVVNAQEPVPRFVDSVDVQVVNLDVFVTDEAGVPVTGLGREDFALLVDGQPRRITNFLAVAGTARETPTPEGAGGVQTVGDAVVLPPLRLVVAVDIFNLERITGNWVYKQLLRFFEESHRGVTETAVVVLDNRMHVRCPPTRDLSLVVEALERISKEAPRGVINDMNRKMTLENIASARGVDEALAIARSHAMEVAARTRQSLSALSSVVSAFAAPEGRTVVLLLSDGFQLRAGEDVFEVVADRFGRGGEVFAEAQSFDVSSVLEKLVTTANAAGVTVYAFEAAGLKAPQSAVAENRSSSARSGLSQFLEDQSRRDPLERLPAATGGFGVTSRNEILGRLHDMATDFTAYYWLGFDPEDGNGEGRIEVKVAAPNVHVRHRESFRRLRAEELMENGVAAVLNGVTPRNPVGIQLRLGSLGRMPGERNAQVELTVRLPSAQLVMIPDGNEATGEVEVVVMAIDEKGRSTPPLHRMVRVTLSEEAAVQGAPVEISFTLVLRPERHTVSVGLRDVAGGEPSYAAVDVDASGDG